MTADNNVIGHRSCDMQTNLAWQDGEGVETDNPVPQQENLMSVQVARKYRHQPAKHEP